LKLKCNETLSNVALEFNVRRYNKEIPIGDDFVILSDLAIVRNPFT